jgi:hypothetical protein
VLRKPAWMQVSDAIPPTLALSTDRRYLSSALDYRCVQGRTHIPVGESPTEVKRLKTS